MWKSKSFLGDQEQITLDPKEACLASCFIQVDKCFPTVCVCVIDQQCIYIYFLTYHINCITTLDESSEIWFFDPVELKQSNQFKTRKWLQLDNFQVTIPYNSSLIWILSSRACDSRQSGIEEM